MLKCDFNKVAKQKFLDKSAFLEISTSMDGIKVKVITMVLTLIMLVIIYCDYFYY